MMDGMDNYDQAAIATTFKSWIKNNKKNALARK